MLKIYTKSLYLIFHLNLVKLLIIKECNVFESYNPYQIIFHPFEPKELFPMLIKFKFFDF